MQKDNKLGARTPDALFSSGFSQVTLLVKQSIQNKQKIINWEKMNNKTLTLTFSWMHFFQYSLKSEWNSTPEKDLQVTFHHHLAPTH